MLRVIGLTVFGLGLLVADVPGFGKAIVAALVVAVWFFLEHWRNDWWNK